MLYALITDTHFGVSGDSKIFHQRNQMFFENILFPKLREQGITNVIHLGDVFHNRHKIDVETMRYARQYFFEPMKDYSLSIIAGNHDLYWKQSSETSTLTELTKAYRFNLFHKACEVDGMLFIPWINNENREHTFKLISETDTKYALGHLSLIGFAQNKGHLASHGDDPKIFAKFKHVYSGHFHIKSSQDNITYLGSPNQQNWGDCGDIRGFHIWDSSNNQLTFVANPYDMYKSISLLDINQQEVVEGNHVRLHYQSENFTQTQIDQFVTKLESSGAVSVKTISRINTFISDQMEQVEVEDTASMINSLITDVKVRNKFMEIYNEALLVE